MNTHAIIQTLILTSVIACTSEQNFHMQEKTWGEPNPPTLADTERSDRHVQVPPSAVDVLFVVDNSGSMRSEQELLASNFDRFITYFIDSDTDWHVGVVSTDMVNPNESGRLSTVDEIRYIDSATPDPITTFQDLAILGTGGDMLNESGRAAAFTALELLRNDYNQGFYRDYATLAIIHISDEEDQSGSQPISLTEYINWLDDLKIQSNDVSVSAIVTPEGGCPTGFSEGLDYLEVTRAFDGVEASICDEDWSEVMDEIGLLASGGRSEFFLSQLPVPGSIRVAVVADTLFFDAEEGECDMCFVYDERRNSIRFNDYMPPEYAEVTIDYTLLANAYEDGDTGI